LVKYHVAPFTILLLLLLVPDTSTLSASEEVRLFIVEKSKNPQNILVVFTHADQQCRIKPVQYGKNAYLFDFYWLMDGTRYKPTHPLIKKHASRRFVAKEPTEDRKGFDVKLADLKELDHDLPSDIITITLHGASEGRCTARVLLPLGPSADGRNLEIEAIYSKARTLLGIPIGVHYIELRGRDAKTGEAITVRFSSKKGSDDQRP